jgi:hypothetical protein
VNYSPPSESHPVLWIAVMTLWAIVGLWAFLGPSICEVLRQK